MKHSIKTQGIVLKGTNFGEADRILTIFTESLGKIKVMAKGLKKIKSHLAGSLEPFILSNLLLHEGKTFYTISGASIVESFNNIHSDLNKVARAFFFGELIDHFVEERQVSPEIFHLFRDSLDETERDIAGPLIQAFELKIIEASGFKPELYDCVHCKEKITPVDNYWDGDEGGVICRSCNDKYHHGRAVSDQVIKLFRFIQNNNSREIARLAIAPEIEAEADRILDVFLRTILERELKSQSFLKSIVRTNNG